MSKLNNLLGEEQIAQKEAAGDIEKVTVARKKEEPASVRKTPEQLKAESKAREGKKQADIARQTQGRLNENFDRTIESVGQGISEGTLPGDTPSAEEKYLGAKIEAIMQDVPLYEKWSKLVGEIEADPQYQDLDVQEQEYLAAEQIELPKGIDNQIKTDIVAWGKKLSSVGKEATALKRRQQKRAGKAQRDYAAAQSVPEGAIVDEEGEAVPVKSLDKAEDEDETSRYFRWKYENSPEHKEAFDAIIEPHLKESLGSHSKLMDRVGKRFKEAEKKLGEREESAKEKLGEKKITQEQFDKAKEVAERKFKETKERIKLDENRLERLKAGEEISLPGGKLIMDDEGKVFSVQRDHNAAIKTIVAGMEMGGVSPEMFLYDRKGTEKEWKRFEKVLSTIKDAPLNPSDHSDEGLINNLKAIKKKANDRLRDERITPEEYDALDLPPKGARLSQEARREWFSKRYNKWAEVLPALQEELKSAHQNISDEPKWKKEFDDSSNKASLEKNKTKLEAAEEELEDKSLSEGERKSLVKKIKSYKKKDAQWKSKISQKAELRKQALQVIKEMHQSWPLKHLPTSPKGGFYLEAGDPRKEVSEDIKDLHGGLKAAGIDMEADELEDGLRQVAQKITPNTLGEESFSDWYDRLTGETTEGELKKVRRDLAAARKSYGLRLAEEKSALSDREKEHAQRVEDKIQDYEKREKDLTSSLRDVQRIEGIDPAITEESPEYKREARKLYDHYLVGEGKAHPDFGVRRSNIEQAKKEFINKVGRELGPHFVSGEDFTDVGKKVLSDKYLGNLFDKYIADKVKTMEGVEEEGIGAAIAKQRHSVRARENEAQKKKNKTASAKAIEKFLSDKSRGGIQSALDSLQAWHGHPELSNSGAVTAEVSPTQKPWELELFPSATNMKRYENALEESEIEGKPAHVEFDVNSYHRDNLANALWDKVTQFQNEGKEDLAQALEDDLVAGSIRNPKGFRSVRGGKDLRSDSPEAKTKAFGEGGVYRDEYFDEDSGKTKWKEYRAKGIVPLVEKIAKKYGVSADKLQKLLPTHEDPSFSRDQHEHLVTELNHVAEEESDGKSKTLANKLAGALQEHRDGFHPYTLTSLMDVGDVESTKLFPGKVARKVLSTSKREKNAKEKFKKKEITQEQFDEAMADVNLYKDLLSVSDAQELQKLIRERTSEGKSVAGSEEALRQQVGRYSTTSEERDLIEKLLARWYKKSAVQDYKENAKIHTKVMHGFDNDWKHRTNILLSQLGADKKNLIKSLMAQFGIDKYEAFEMFKSMEPVMPHQSLYLDNSLFKASFLPWPQSKENFDNSFSRIHVGVNPEETPSFESDEEQRKDDEKREARHERRKSDEERDKGREQRTEKSLGLFVSV